MIGCAVEATGILFSDSFDGKLTASLIGGSLT